MTEPEPEVIPLIRWVCDGCMRRVRAVDVYDFADGEHVLCRDCFYLGEEQP